jgi:hypothetical protein
VLKEIDIMEKEAKSMRTEALKMTWYMRGGLSYTESMLLSQTERESIAAIIKENLETTKKSGLPFY